ncbi:MAG: class I SAM-dependent methyltransferase [Alphaproteobacteria bacterium]
MSVRHKDGSAGDVNYGLIGPGYSRYRQPDPRISYFIKKELIGAKSVLNVGAGPGSYEPTDKNVTAVEPSASMRAQRPAHLAVAIDAVAERLPFEDNSFDASMASFTVHQWPDLEAGLKGMRRVTKEKVLILTCAPDEVDRFWLNDYAPEVLAVEAARYPRIETIRKALGGEPKVVPVPIPLDCTDGFIEAYYGRPERFLDPGARTACSSWSLVESSVVKRFECELSRDLENGTWESRYGHFRKQPQFDGSLKLVIG